MRAIERSDHCEISQLREMINLPIKLLAAKKGAPAPKRVECDRAAVKKMR